MSGYDCKTCTESQFYLERGCTGIREERTERGFEVVEGPRPSGEPATAYRNGWIDIAAEAAFSGDTRLKYALDDATNISEPIPMCPRLIAGDVSVRVWLRVYQAIRRGLRHPPVDAPWYYDHIMLSIDAEVLAFEDASFKAAQAKKD